MWLKYRGYTITTFKKKFVITKRDYSLHLSNGVDTLKKATKIIDGWMDEEKKIP